MKTARILCLVLAFTACKKDSANHAAPTDLGAPKPVAVDISKIKAPALFENIPADSPYVIGSLEAFPLEYMSKMKQALRPVFAKTLGQLHAIGSDNEITRVLDAISAEFDGKLNEKGLETLGLSAQPRFAFYGLGLLPAVMRIEIHDDKLFLATIERIAKRAGVTLPAPQTLGDRTYWRIDVSSVTGIVAVNKNELVVAVGPAPRVESSLALILGTEKPKQNMGGGAALIEVMTKHGFGPYLIGFSDLKAVGKSVVDYAGQTMSASCSTEIDNVAARVPRVVFGYSEITAKRVTGGFVVEMAPDLTAEITAMKTEIPGLSDMIAGDPMMAFAGGFDLTRGQQLAQAMAATVSRIGAGCASDKLVEAGEGMTKTFAKPLPAPFGQIAGGAMVLYALSMPKAGGMPDQVDAFAAMSSPSAKKLFEAFKALGPIDQLGIVADGSLHKLSIPMPLPFEVNAGVGERSIVVAAGPSGKQLAEKVINAKGGDKAPLLVMSMDQGKITKLQAQLDRMNGAPDVGANDVADVLGRSTMVLDTSKLGLSMWATIDLK